MNSLSSFSTPDMGKTFLATLLARLNNTQYFPVYANTWSMGVRKIRLALFKFFTFSVNFIVGETNHIITALENRIMPKLRRSNRSYSIIGASCCSVIVLIIYSFGWFSFERCFYILRVVDIYTLFVTYVL